MIRLLTIMDYEEIYHLWLRTPGMGLNSLDDSREGIKKFLEKNPATSFVAVEDAHIVGVILSGHDGRRGYLYHACVEEAYRRRCIGKELLGHVTEAMKAEKISKLSLVCFKDNAPGNSFWDREGWKLRRDLNFYDIVIIPQS